MIHHSLHFLIPLIFVVVSSQSEAEGQCSLARAEIEDNLRLEFEDFDQNPEGGWRPYYENGCYESAAELIKAYMAEHQDISERHYILPFHAGQMFALSGHYHEAITYMKKAYSSKSSELVDWNAFVDANIAFLEKNMGTLIDMREQISLQTPMPDSPGVPAWAVGKRINLDVVNGFIQCFGKTYEVAYGTSCRRDAEGQIVD